MKPFKTAEHICSWAGLCPGNNESAGKRKSTSVTKGNPYIKSMLCEIAWVIAGKRNTYLSAWYWRIKQKKGAKKAIVALARKLLAIIYTMLKQGTLFDESLSLSFHIRLNDLDAFTYPSCSALSLRKQPLFSMFSAIDGHFSFLGHTQDSY